MVTEKFPMTIGDEEVLNEHLLLAYNEDGNGFSPECTFSGDSLQCNEMQPQLYGEAASP